jgi:hypothetical protein
VDDVVVATKPVLPAKDLIWAIWAEPIKPALAELALVLFESREARK